ncbi:CAMK/CAMKL/KIN1 protein kinase Kin1 [Schizosaccharomyces cryophilus OY26]|uniref:non-specific serine/threonine protein kinase n=1 Tax=Schizosaccharomyces cryophilus (strain OY26 / ATCC MYA-4695 / CBS 11777 / NBRC 106824 / NRRL Y48691) TaxID=653667 RepID=S9XJK5_SCHCR|nr:CAMK/CAMKL/KIN1 protein kinase Kin1 [Schizosaccharomyces cryophilus OY26]EPY53881.1 CAMK/CAMKL/KIN1 protein kinase Kin1 [Schizosaccharomyces cryophilus OY26]
MDNHIHGVPAVSSKRAAAMNALPKIKISDPPNRHPNLIDAFMQSPSHQTHPKSSVDPVGSTFSPHISSSALGPKRSASARKPLPTSPNRSREHGLRVPATSSPLNSDDKPRERRKVIGNYVLGKTIGAGSMGKVKVAHHIKTGEQVAIKIVTRQNPDSQKLKIPSQETLKAAQSEKNREIRTVREAALSTLLRHPYICEARDVYITSSHYYIAFEFVDGGQMLDYIISHGKLKEKQARKFVRQIGSALKYLHHNSIVHRDLKIENILISKNGDIKIIDFGLSNLYMRQSRLRTFCGSLYFAAPELLNAQPYIGPEVDIWSFGIVLYVLVCGKVPFDDQNMSALHAKIKKGTVEYPSYLSGDCKSLLSRMLVTDPLKRASLDEILNHPWMNRNYDGPMPSFAPERSPITLPLDQSIIKEMNGFDFGPPEKINRELTKVISSEAYQSLAKTGFYSGPISADKKKTFFEFRIRHAAQDIENPILPSLSISSNVYDAFHPLLSIYYLVLERKQYDRGGTWNRFVKTPVSSVPSSPIQTQSFSRSLPPMPEISDNPVITKANEPNDDDLSRITRKLSLVRGKPSPETQSHLPSPSTLEKKSSSIFRRFSSRRKQSRSSSSNRSSSSTLQISAPLEATQSPVVPRTKVSSKPPISYKNKVLNSGNIGRSTSVREGRYAGVDKALDSPVNDSTLTSGVPPAVQHNRLLNPRGASLGRGKIADATFKQKQVLSDTMGEPIGKHAEAKSQEKVDPIKPVFLKGLFSVSTTSTKNTETIQRDLIRVMELLDIEYKEIKGGYSCIYRPQGNVPNTLLTTPAKANNNQSRRLPSGGSSFSTESYGYVPDTVQVGTSEEPVSSVLMFEIYIVKVPILSLRGVSFHRISGNSWQYKTLASRILNELKL